MPDSLGGCGMSGGRNDYGEFQHEFTIRKPA